MVFLSGFASFFFFMLWGSGSCRTSRLARAGFGEGRRRQRRASSLRSPKRLPRCDGNGRGLIPSLSPGRSGGHAAAGVEERGRSRSERAGAEPSPRLRFLLLVCVQSPGDSSSGISAMWLEQRGAIRRRPSVRPSRRPSVLPATGKHTEGGGERRKREIIALNRHACSQLPPASAAGGTGKITWPKYSVLEGLWGDNEPTGR